MRKNVQSRLSTDTKDLRTLIEEIRKGEVKIPQFQRKYVWKEEQALSLLDSIANNYPVGSILLWKTHNRMQTERNIGAFNLPETDDVDPTDYVLDGQQRLTVIYSCMGAAEEDHGFAAGYDLETEEFVRIPKGVAPIHVFPLRWTYDMTKMLNFRTTLTLQAKRDELTQRFDNMYGALTRYKIPVVTLKDLTIEEVCPIFERINSSGTKLSTYDLMVASTWSKSFDLNQQAEAIQEALKPKGFHDIEGGTVLKCLTTVQYASVRRKDIFKLRAVPSTSMNTLVEKATAALMRTVDLLSTEFLIYSWDFLPYEALVILLTALQSDVSSLKQDQLVRVRQWFWRSAFSERYRGTPDNFISNDIDKFKAFVLDRNGKPDQFGAPPLPEMWLEEAFRSNNSRSRAFILALAALKPRNLTNGVTIDVTSALSVYNQKQFHHIYPRAYLKRISAPGEHNAVANICMLAASENRQLGDRDPGRYMPECIAGLGKQAKSVFASNVLPDPAEFDYSTSDYPAFLSARVPLVVSLVASLCEGDMPK